MSRDILNTVYIISKGRPQCVTAETLSRINYPGEWFIVCGNNDETLPEYQKKWGDKVLVFDWYKEIKYTDPMDNFGFKDKASGACPVRNATVRISRERGEKRHWQFDDDYFTFYAYNPLLKKNKSINGKILYEKMKIISEFGYTAKINNVGFCLQTIEAVPKDRYKFRKRVFNAHNLPSTEDLFVPWVGRMNDDLINAINVWRKGGKEFQFLFTQIGMQVSQQTAGGLTELYKQDGTVRKTAYAIMACPVATRLVVKFGRYHHSLDIKKITPKIIREEFKKL